MSVPVAAIGTVTLASGGRIGLVAMPGRGGDLGSDIEHMIAWKPDIVVSLATLPELKRTGADQLGSRLTTGIDWAHFPIADFDVPTHDQVADWAALSAKLLAQLAAGGSVLLHCQAGLGRSGMVALRLILLSGENPDGALARLRSTRPGAIETDAQMQWAFAGTSG
jgi:protein-tyrosine phosphatase